MPDKYGKSYDWEEEVECAECGGEGQYEVCKPVIDYAHGGYYDNDIEECETCGGSGVVYQEIEEE